MSEKLANTGVSPNTCIHPCPTPGGLIEPIHHNEWINLPFDDTSPLYTKLSESNLPNSFLLPPLHLVLCICLFPLHLFDILLKASGRVREGAQAM